MRNWHEFYLAKYLLISLPVHGALPLQLAGVVLHGAALVARRSRPSPRLRLQHHGSAAGIHIEGILSKVIPSKSLRNQSNICHTKELLVLENESNK